MKTAASFILILLAVSCATKNSKQSAYTGNRMITENSIGDAQIGQTVADFSAKQQGSVLLKKGSQVYAANDSNELLYSLSISSDSRITSIKCENPVFKTADGIYVGMKISDAAKILGKATITIYSSLDESPEFVSFSNFKGKKFRFQAKSRTKSEAGKYMQSEGGIISSEKIYPDSYISSIIIGKK